MSAWMVSDAHLDLLATAWVQFIDPDADPQAIGRQLADDCAASIRARYEDRHGCAAEAEAQAAAYRYRPWLGNIDPTLLAVQVACFDYQACESSDWKERPSFTACERLQGRLVAIGVDYEHKTVNGRPYAFNSEPWGIDEEHRTGAGTLEAEPLQLTLISRDGTTVH